MAAYGPRDTTLALAIARQAAVAFENARLYESAERRARDLEAVFQADRRIYQSLRVPDVLDALVDVAAEVLRADRTSVMVWDERHERLVVGAVRGFGPEVVAAMSHGPGDGITWVVATTGEPVAIEDAAADPRVAHRITGPEGIRSVVHVPLVVGGEVFGVFGVNFCEPRRFDGQEQRVLSALAQRAAVAIENARLHERGRGRPRVLEERERLARELHDSVTQSLYAVSLHAEAASRALADGEAEPVASNLADIRETVQEALGEMRLLLFELRPPLLQEHGLAGGAPDAAAAPSRRGPGSRPRSRARAPTRLRPETEQELYRVAQEALNNVLKHAHASRATVRLDAVDGRAALEVVDDGVGFEPALRGGDGFGLPGHARARRAAGRQRCGSRARPARGRACERRYADAAALDAEASADEHWLIREGPRERGRSRD